MTENTEMLDYDPNKGMQLKEGEVYLRHKETKRILPYYDQTARLIRDGSMERVIFRNNSLVVIKEPKPEGKEQFADPNPRKMPKRANDLAVPE